VTERSFYEAKYPILGLRGVAQSVHNPRRMSLEPKHPIAPRRRLCLSPRRSTVRALALGLGLLAPSLAHADDGDGDENVTVPVAASEDRPLHMRDLGTSSSLGFEADGGMVQLSTSDGMVNAYEGVLALDGELAVGEHLKLFTFFPVSGVRGKDADHGRAGHGNLTLGGQLQGSVHNIQLGVGGSFSDWGQADGAFGGYLRDDFSSFASTGPVFHTFASVKRADPHGYLQAELGYTDVTSGSSVDMAGNPPDTKIGSVTLGGGTRVNGWPMLLVEVTAMHHFERDNPHTNAMVGDIGLRGRFSDDSRSTWSTKLSFMRADGVATYGLGFELRTDLPGLAGK
jgi:hypothetical protein